MADIRRCEAEECQNNEDGDCDCRVIILPGGMCNRYSVQKEREQNG